MHPILQPSLQPYASQVGHEAVAVEVAERGAKVVAVGEVCVGIRAIDCTLTMAISSLPTLLAMAITSMALDLPWRDRRIRHHGYTPPWLCSEAT